MKPIEILVYENENEDMRNGLVQLIQETPEFKLLGFSRCMSVTAQVKNAAPRDINGYRYARHDRHTRRKKYQAF